MLAAWRTLRFASSFTRQATIPATLHQRIPVSVAHTGAKSLSVHSWAQCIGNPLLLHSRSFVSRRFSGMQNWRITAHPRFLQKRSKKPDPKRKALLNRTKKIATTGVSRYSKKLSKVSSKLKYSAASKSFRNATKRAKTSSKKLSRVARVSSKALSMRARASSKVKARAPSKVKARAPSKVKPRAPSKVRAEAPSKVKPRAPSKVRARAPSKVKARSSKALSMKAASEARLKSRSKLRKLGKSQKGGRRLIASPAAQRKRLDCAAAKRLEKIHLIKGHITQPFQSPAARLEWYRDLKTKFDGEKTQKVVAKKTRRTGRETKKNFAFINEVEKQKIYGLHYDSLRTFIKRVNPVVDLTAFSPSQLVEKYHFLRADADEKKRLKKAETIRRRLELLGKLPEETRQHTMEQFADWWQHKKDEIDLAKGRRMAYKRSRLSFSPTLAPDRLIILWYREQKKASKSTRKAKAQFA